MSFQQRTLALVLLALAAAGFAGCGSGGGEETTAVSTQAEAAKPEGGELTFALTIDDDTEGEEASLRMASTFWRPRPGAAPSFHASVVVSGRIDGEPRRFSGGLTAGPRRAVLEYEGRSYVLDPKIIEVIGSYVRYSPPCRRALRRISLSRLVERSGRKLRETGTGEGSLHETIGSLDLSVAHRAMLQLGRHPGCANQLEMIPMASTVFGVAFAALQRQGIKSKAETATGPEGAFRRLYVQLFLHTETAGGHEYDGSVRISLEKLGEVKPIPPPPQGEPVAALVKRIGHEEAVALEAGAGGLTSILEAAYGG